ncbi:MAG: RAMP superfamily CRISPR-associated protein [Cyanobacteria bacterium P01_H01_bin.21]
MSHYQFQIELLSDTTFGRGDGVAGLVDQEVEHDRYGLPYLRGRTLKGLLSEECDNLITCLSEEAQRQYWNRVACQLFGRAGSSLDTIAKAHFGDAQLPDDLRTAVAHQVRNEQFTRAEILESLTTIRRQTAIDPQTGVPDEGSLRSLRVALQELTFTATLLIDNDTLDSDIKMDHLLALLTVGASALRYLGNGRNRGRGHVRCCLLNESRKPLSKDFSQYLDIFFNHQNVSLPTTEVS